MRYSKTHKAQTRDRIVRSAASLFREKGIDQVSVPGLMADAGLTHGGFYAHFSSKDELVAAAISQSLDETTTRLLARAEEGSGLTAVIRTYLSQDHRDAPGQGCALAALASEVARGGGQGRGALGTGLHTLVDRLAGLVKPRPDMSRQDQTLVLVSTLVGALLLARASDDEKYSENILQTCARFLEQSFAEPESDQTCPPRSEAPDQ